MGQFVKVGTVADFEDVDGGKLVDAGGRSLAVFRVGTNYYAIHNTCTHRGGPLAEGTLVGEEVICPWHGAPRLAVETDELQNFGGSWSLPGHTAAIGY